MNEVSGGWDLELIAWDFQFSVMCMSIVMYTTHLLLAVPDYAANKILTPNSHFIWDGMTCRSLSLWNVSIVILASQKENRDVSWGFGKITVAWKWQTGCCPCVENNLKDWSFHLAPSELTLTGYTRLCSVGGWSHLVTSLVYSIHRGKKRSELRKQHELEETIW